MEKIIKVIKSKPISTAFDVVIFGTNVTMINRLHSGDLPLNIYVMMLVGLLVSYILMNFVRSEKEMIDTKSVFLSVRGYIVNIFSAFLLATLYGELTLSPVEVSLALTISYIIIFSNMYIFRENIVEFLVKVGRYSV